MPELRLTQHRTNRFLTGEPYRALFFPNRAICALATLTAVAGCQMAPMPPDPIGRASSDMTRVLAAYQASGAKPVDTLSVAAARAQPTPGDAAAGVTQQMSLPAKMPLAKVVDIQIDGAAGPLAARVYDPQAGHGPTP